MNLTLTEKEKAQLLFAINQTIRTSENALQVSAEVLPLAARISELKEQPTDPAVPVSE